MKIIYTDVLIIGGGLAGLRVATGVKERGHDAVVLTLVPPKRSHSSAAQGGMQASLANCYMGEGDDEDVHFMDTIKGSDWGADQEIARMFTHTAHPKQSVNLQPGECPGAGSIVVITQRSSMPRKSPLQRKTKPMD